MDTTVANLAVVYVLFNSCNFFMYFGAMTLVQFLAIIDRTKTVFAMEEASIGRDTSVAPSDVSIQIENADFSWGFKVQENQTEAKSGRKLT